MIAVAPGVVLGRPEVVVEVMAVVCVDKVDTTLFIPFKLLLLNEFVVIEEVKTEFCIGVDSMPSISSPALVVINAVPATPFVVFVVVEDVDIVDDVDILGDNSFSKLFEIRFGVAVVTSSELEGDVEDVVVEDVAAITCVVVLTGLVLEPVAATLVVIASAL